MHAPTASVLQLLRHAETRVEKPRANAEEAHRGAELLHRAEPNLLLVRLAADTGARRGELATLKTTDLVGRVLTISRGASAEQIGPTKTKRTRRLTVGATTASMWHDSVTLWVARLPAGDQLGEWLFSRYGDHHRRLSTSYLAKSFAQLCHEAGVPDVTLHRLRHSVATYLVGRGDLLKAQQRLGHRDASATLRNYAHALPLEDEEVADDLDALLNDAGHQ